MGQQEDFRTPVGRADAAAEGPAPPFFDDQSALKAAPVVPLDRVARRSRFANWTGGNWRDTVNSPQFRRSWPLALLLVATLAAAVAATNIYTNDDDPRNVTRTTAAATAESTAGATATADAEKPVASPARDDIDNSLQARDARRGRESNVSADAAAAGNPEAFAASALGNFPGDDGDARDGQDEPAASGRDERGGERDKGKRQKRSKRRHGARRTSGGAILFDVIR